MQYENTWLASRVLNEGGKGGAIPRAPNHYGAPNHSVGRRMTAGGAEKKSPSNVTSTFFSAVHLPSKDVRFEYGGAKLASCPGRQLTSLRPCLLEHVYAGLLEYAF